MRTQTEEDSPLWERCSSDDAEIFCKSWGKVYLWESCDDLIHSLGAYDTHNRKPVSEIELSPKTQGKTFEFSQSQNVEDTSNIENVDPLKTDQLQEKKNLYEMIKQKESNIVVSKLNGTLFLYLTLNQLHSIF